MNLQFHDELIPGTKLKQSQMDYSLSPNVLLIYIFSTCPHFGQLRVPSS